MSAAPPTAAPGRDDGMARYGWLMAAVWLVFLVFPLSAVWGSDRATGLRIVATALVAAFAAVYVRAFRLVARLEAEAGREPATGPAMGARAAAGYLAALIALSVAAFAASGAAALGLVPFVVSFAVFNLEWPAVGAVALAGLATVVVVPLWLGLFADLWFLVLIVLAVGVATVLVRVVEGHERERADLQTRVAVSDERGRLARDVHDVLGHSLTAVILKAELCERLLEGVDPGADEARARVTACREQLAELQAVSRGALAEIRSTVGGLRSADLSDELMVARTVLADAGVSLDVTGDPARSPEALRPVLAWVVREAVTNIVRHARASRCRIELMPPAAPAERAGSGTGTVGEGGAPGSLVVLRISDDGVGLGGRPEGNGLRGLRERVGAAGASLRLGAGDGATIEVVAVVPGAPAPASTPERRAAG